MKTDLNLDRLTALATHPWGLRPKEKRRMTIAIGILAPDGVVLAADTELNSGESKFEGTKFSISAAGIATAGSGDLNYIEALSELIVDAFESDSHANLQTLEARFRQIVKGFHDEHIRPEKTKGLQVSLLIGASRGQRGLWVAHQSTLRRCRGIMPIGYGSPAASRIIRPLLEPPCKILDMDTAERLAGYVVGQLKEQTAYCGKSTEMVRVGNGTAEKRSEHWMSLMEHHTQRLFALQNRTAQFALGCITAKEPASIGEHIGQFYISTNRQMVKLKDITVDGADFTL